jgi:hypothetical protein
MVIYQNDLLFARTIAKIDLVLTGMRKVILILKDCAKAKGPHLALPDAARMKTVKDGTKSNLERVSELKAQNALPMGAWAFKKKTGGLETETTGTETGHAHLRTTHETPKMLKRSMTMTESGSGRTACLGMVSGEDEQRLHGEKGKPTRKRTTICRQCREIEIAMVTSLIVIETGVGGRRIKKMGIGNVVTCAMIIVTESREDGVGTNLRRRILNGTVSPLKAKQRSIRQRISKNGKSKCIKRKVQVIKRCPQQKRIGLSLMLVHLSLAWRKRRSKRRCL